MELKPGYKQTEVGVIPEDWSVQALGDLGQVLIGLTYKPEQVADHGTLVLRSSNIHDNALALSDNVYVVADVPEEIMTRPGDILICVRNGSRELIGKTALLDERCIGMTFGAFMAVFRSPIGSLVNYCFQSSVLKLQIAAHLGATINQITNKSLRSFKIAIPSSTEERERIVGALQEVDSLIERTNSMIAKKKNIKQAAMQELISGKRRLPGFEGEWEEFSLGSVASMNSGGTPPTGRDDYYGGGIPWVSISDMTSGGKFIYQTERTLSAAGLVNCAAKQFPAGTILYAMYASLGECSIAATEVTSSQAILGIRPGASLHNEYLFYYLSSIHDKVKLMGQQGTQSNLNKGIVQGFTLRLPGKAEQIAIAEALGEIDQELNALSMKAQKIRETKAGMMQQLLTGKIRLT
jgi:type I restriction enzyme S subunit